jgi:predicted phosphoadenosine phosphosulfate sulfurtransferase
MKLKIEKYIKDWESKCYKGGLPDFAPVELEKNCNVPSYRKIAYAILKCDSTLKTLGLYSNKRSKVYNDIKRSQLIKEGRLKINQTNLFQ